jgi:hypothetical protein
VDQEEKKPPVPEGAEAKIPEKKKLDLDSVTILFIAAEEKPILQTQNFLKKRGWTTYFCNSIKDAVADVSNKKPDFVLISWNIPNTHIPKVERMITASFNVPCIIFTERVLDGTAQSQITASSIKQYILSPVSGPSVHMKIRKLIMQGETSTKKENVRAKGAMTRNTDGDSFRVKSKPEELPKDGEWDRTGTSEDGEPIWMLKTKKKTMKNGKKGAYVFKGKQPPVLGENGWTGTEGGTLEFEESDLNPGRQKSAEDDSGKEVIVRSESEGEVSLEETNKESSKPTDEDDVQIQATSAGQPESDQEKRLSSKRAQSTDLPDGFGPEEEDSSDKKEKVKSKGYKPISDAGDKTAKMKIKIAEDTPEAIAKKKELKEEEEKKVARQLEAKKESEQKRKQAQEKRVEEKRAAAELRQKKKEEKETQRREHLELEKKAREEREVAASEKVLEREKERQKLRTEKESKDQMGPESGSTEDPLNKQPGRVESGAPSIDIENNQKQSQVPLTKEEKKKSYRESSAAERNQIAAKEIETQKEKAEGRSKARASQESASEERDKPKLESVAKEAQGEERKKDAPEAKEKQKRDLTPAAKAPVEKQTKEREAQEKIEKTERPARERAEQEVRPVEVAIQSATEAGPDANHGDLQATQGDVSAGVRFRNKTKIFGKSADSVLAQCVIKALEASVVSNDSEVATPLKVSSTIDCIPINSARFKGILIYSTSAEEPLGPEFTRSMKNQLLQMMNERGEDMKDEGELVLDVSGFEFVQVISDFAEFLTVTAHVGAEVGMAFIQSDGVFPPMKPNEQGMIPVEVENLDAGEKVKFDAYIHMPINQKYVKYVKNGGTLEARQKASLTELSYKHFYVKDNEVKELKGHCASAFVQRMVKQFTNALKKAV